MDRYGRAKTPVIFFLYLHILGGLLLAGCAATSPPAAAPVASPATKDGSSAPEGSLTTQELVPSLVPNSATPVETTPNTSSTSTATADDGTFAGREDAFGLLLDITGEAEIRHVGWKKYAPIQFATRLTQDDIVRLNGNATATLVCDDLSLQPLLGNKDSSLIAMSRVCPEGSPKLVERDGALVPAARPGIGDDIPYILSPRHTSVQQDELQFTWQAVNSDSYSVKVKDASQGTVLWETTSATTSVSYAGSELVPGDTYQLIVTTNDGVSSADEGPVSFTVLSDEAQEQLEEWKALIEQMTSLSPAARDFLLAQVYMESGLHADAIAQLAGSTQPRAPIAELLLGDLYSLIGLGDQAEEAYQAALEGETVVRADALVALAQIERNRREDETARATLNEALQLYQTLGAIDRIKRAEEIANAWN